MWTKAKSFLRMTPDETFSAIKNKCISEKNRETCKRIGITAILTCFFNYFYFIINGYSGPDSLIEGVYYYTGGNTATASARWFIPYINDIFGKNVVIPLVIIVFYSLMIAVAAFFLFDLWEINNAGFQILSTAAMVCYPVVTRQFAYLYTALAYSTSFLMVVLAARLLKKKRIGSFIAATVCLIIMFGSFQSYIGAAAAIVVISLILDLLKKEPILQALENVFQYLISGVIAGVADLIILNAIINAKGLTAYDRVSQVSLSETLKYLDFSIPASYKWFFSYFKLDVLARNKLYIVLFTIITVLIIFHIIMLLKEKKIVHSVLLVASILLLPLAMNACVVIFPHNGIYDLMRYQYVLLIPFAFALFTPFAKTIASSLIQWLTYITVFLLIVGFTISSNASAICYKLAYESTHDQAISMLSRVYELDGYDPNGTPIMFGGQAIDYNDTYLAFAPLFRYAVMESGPVFWTGEFGLTASRYFFFRNCMGVDAYGLSSEEYWYVVGTQEYFEMPCWPAEGSVKMIDGYAVIKITDY